MNDIDIKFIKWMLGKDSLNRWKIFENESKQTHGLMYIPKEEETMYSSEFYKNGSGFKYGITVYHILLQRAMDGINKESYFGSSQIEIVSHRWGIKIKDYSTDNHDKKHFRFESYENYKESALKYIYEQETKDS